MKKNSRKIFSFMLALAIMMTSFAIPSNAETVKAETYTTNIKPSDYKNYVDYLEASTLSLGGKKVNPNDSTDMAYDTDGNGNALYYTYLSLATLMKFVIPANCTTLLVDIGNIPAVGYNSDGTKTVIVRTDGYNKQGYDKDGYNRSGYNMSGYDRNGYDRSGYNAKGFDKDGYDRSGYNMSGYDRNGYDRNGYDRNGYDRNGYDRDGYDRNGYDRDGYNKDGKNKDKGIKINKVTFGDLASILSKKEYDEDRDGYLSDDEIMFLVKLNVNGKINNIKGLELLTGCRHLILGNYTGKTININSESIKEVEIHSKTALTVNASYAKEVVAEGTKVTINAPNAVVVYGRTTESLNLKKCKSARGIDVVLGKNNKKLILPENKKNLEVFECCGKSYGESFLQANISTLNLSKYENLKILTFYHCGVKNLNVTGCKKLSYFYMYDCNKIKTVDFSKNKKFVAGDFYGCKALKTIKNPPKGKITRGKGRYWCNGKKYQKFLKDNNLTDRYLNKLV